MQVLALPVVRKYEAAFTDAVGREDGTRYR
jgi:hypothetical protein